MLKQTFLYFSILLGFTFSSELAKIDVVATKDGSIPLQNASIVFKSSNGQSFNGVTDSAGLFSLELPKSTPMTIYVKSITGQYEVGQLNIPKHVAGGKWNVEFNDDQMELANVFFDPGKYTLLEGSFEALRSMAKGMKSNPKYKFEIAGHTDNVGSDQANLALSQKRAQSVVDFLISEGIDPKRLKAQGYGESQPKADNSTPEGRELNRRIEARPIH